jgi:hypothetical protein
VANYSITDIKTLFALSCNRCAFPGCDERLSDPAWGQVKADIAHIYGEKEGSARWDPGMTDAQRNSYDNLILLCPNHHRLIDRLRPEDYPASDVSEMKAHHEQSCDQGWATESELSVVATMAVALALESVGEAGPKPHPRLVLQREGDQALFVENVGDADAVTIRLTPIGGEGGVLRLHEPPDRMSPGARWRAGAHVRTMGNAGPRTIRIEWTGSDGHQYDGEYPL